MTIRAEKDCPTDRVNVARRRTVIVLSVAALAMVSLYALLPWLLHSSDKVACSVVVDRDAPPSHIQYGIKEQSIEPYFNGSIFISSANTATTPTTFDIRTTARRSWGDSGQTVQMYPRKPTNELVMHSVDDFTFYRTSGSYRDFPFDSTTVDFETTFTPAVITRAVQIRNFNPSFYVPCRTVSVTKTSNDTLHVSFELRRNPIVPMTALVMLCGAILFVVVVPVRVKRDSLAPSVASFFFSVWAIRGILNSEIKIFPTMLDNITLMICTLLVVVVGLRLLWEWLESR